MPFVQAKCPMCGGMLAVDDRKKAAVCQFCGDAFIVEEAVNNYNTYNITNNTTNQNFGEGAVVNIIENSSSISAIMERVFMFLEEGDFFSADEYCEKALDLDPKCAEAYLGKLLVDLKCRRKDSLIYCDKPFDKNTNYEKIVRFGDSDMLEELKGYLDAINERKEEEKIEEQEIKKNKVIVKETLKLIDKYRAEVDKAIAQKQVETIEALNQSIAKLQVEIESHKTVLKGIGLFKTSERKVEKDTIARLESEIASLKRAGGDVQFQELQKKGNESVLKYKAEVEDFLERKYNLLLKKNDNEKIDIEAIHKKEGGDFRKLKVLKVLYDFESEMTVSEVVEELEKINDGETITNMWVSAVLKKLVESGNALRTEVARKAYFSISDTGVYRLKGVRAPQGKPYVENKVYSNQQCPEMPNIEEVLKFNQ